MKRASLRWIEAGKVLSENPSAKVRCPENDDDFLVIEDALPSANATHVERHIRCPKCGAYNSVLLENVGKKK